jgi:competence protein ComEC
VISPLYAPTYCAPKILLDRRKLAETGSVTLAFGAKGVAWRTARAPGEDRPWSKAPRRHGPARHARVAPATTEAPPE